MESSQFDRQDVFERVLFGAHRAMVLLAVWEVGVFHHLRAHPSTLVELAASLGVVASKLGPFLDALCQQGLLARKDDLYSLVPGDEPLFANGGPLDDSLSSTPLEAHFSMMARAPDVLRTGRSIEAAGSGGPATAKVRGDFLRHLHLRSADVAREMAQILAATPFARVLDLGCGAGTYTYALLRTMPDARATLVDRRTARPIIDSCAASEGLSARVRFCPVDIGSALPDGEYDLVVLSNLVHCYSAGWNRSLLSRIAALLAPGGRIAIKDYKIEPDRLTPESSVWFRVTMAMYGNDGDVHPPAVIESWLREAGMRAVAIHGLEREADSFLIVSTKC